MVRILLSALLLALFSLLLTHADAIAKSASFEKGVNLSNWLANADRQEVNEEDLAQIKAAGFDHVRLPVNPENFQLHVDDKRFLKPGPYFRPVDEAISLILKHNLVVILDVHPHEAYRNKIEQGGQEEHFAEMWRNLALHYQDVPASELVFELLNEPQYYRREDSYNTLVRETVAAIRQVDKTRTIIIGAPRGSSVDGINQLRIINDPNIVYSFHFYEPYMITHQGIHMGFEDRMLRYFKALPYPSNRAVKNAKFYAPDAPNSAQAAEEFGEYKEEDWNAQRIDERIRIAADWAQRYNVKLHCGEFGVLRNHVDPESRYQWIKDARTAMEKYNIAWSLWDYSDLFGIVRFEGARTSTDPVDGAVRFSQMNSQGKRVIEQAARDALGLRSSGIVMAPSVISPPAVRPSSNQKITTLPAIGEEVPMKDDVSNLSSEEPGDINAPETIERKWRKHWHGQRMNERNIRRSQGDR